MPHQNAFSCDLAIFAVASDSALVTELMAALSPRLQTLPVWVGHVEQATATASAANADDWRMALLLYQRLWQHDEATHAESSTLRKRLRERPGSVCVMRLDDTPLPVWLGDAPTYDLQASGLDDAADFAVNAIVSIGGTVRPANGGESDGDAAEAPRRWVDAPTPFLGQLRAHSALRHELDAMSVALKSEVALRQDAEPESPCELHALPNRLIARFGDRGLSFSWIGAALPSVAEGRLLVIEWRGVSQQTRGVAALKSAVPVREEIYRPEGKNAEGWHWRKDVPNGRAFSTANLIAQAVSGLALTAAE